MEELTLILIDDNKMMNFLHTKLISMAAPQAEVKSFTRADQALDFVIDSLDNASGKSMLILLDINMPVMDGFQFLSRISENPHSREIPVIMVSSSTADDDKRRAGEFVQVQDYVEKPLAKDKLISLLEKVAMQKE